jgi:septal ring factor EnvC (AmiA/AmiB activator)
VVAALLGLLWIAPGSAAPSADAEAVGPAKAGNKSAESAAPSLQRRRELQGEQHELKSRLIQLKKSLAATETAHSEAADALAASETAISSANRHLQQLTASRHQVEQRIGELQASQKELANAQNTHASRLGLAARKEFGLLHPPVMLSLLDPVQLAQDQRDSAYLDWVVRERVHRIGELDDRRARLAALEAESRQRSQELARIDADERTSRGQLLKQEAVRKSTLVHLARQIANQRQSVASLERDDARMGSLIEQIGRLLTEQARRRANPSMRGKNPRQDEPAGHPEEAAPAVPNAEHFEPPSATRFARLRGKLVLPVQGPIGSRYGSARLTEDGQAQAGAPAWKGLFIRAPAGSPVHAVAAGRVVFADWLRGFGNLMILDHGEGFLSVYANNETLLHSVGDQITADEVIASVGNTGGNVQSGLYFEMRYQGRPFDPLSWAAAR